MKPVDTEEDPPLVPNPSAKIGDESKKRMAELAERIKRDKADADPPKAPGPEAYRGNY